MTWTTQRCDVPHGTRIEIFDRMPDGRGWSHKVGKVHYHGEALHMAKNDCEFIDIVPAPPMPVGPETRQVWRKV